MLIQYIAVLQPVIKGLTGINHLFMASSSNTSCIFSRLKGTAFFSGNKDECLTQKCVCVHVCVRHWCACYEETGSSKKDQPIKSNLLLRTNDIIKVQQSASFLHTRARVRMRLLWKHNKKQEIYLCGCVCLWILAKQRNLRIYWRALNIQHNIFAPPS